MWEEHDKYMNELKRLYNTTSKQTQNRLQELLDTFDFTYENLYNIADTKTKSRINTYIEEWKENKLLTGYFGVLANNIYSKKRVKNSEILELLIYSAYIEEQNKLEEQEQQIMYNDASCYYKKGFNEVNKTLPEKKQFSVMNWALFLAILDQISYNGLTYKQNQQSIIQYNAQQLYKQAIYNIQQGKELKIDFDEFQRIINQQNNQKLCINDDKISGSIDLTTIALDNLAKVEGIKAIAGDNARVRFIAVEDEKTTQMCQSMDGMLFYINKENEFTRYWGETQKDLAPMQVKVNGLVTGINLPPIIHHFHYCRSTITYQVEYKNEIGYNDMDYPSYIRLNVKDGYKPESEIDIIVEAITKLPGNIRELIKDTEFEIFSKGNIIRDGKIVKNSFYDRKEDKIYIIDGNDLTNGEIIHEVGHAVETKLNILNDIKYINIRNKGLENYNKDSIKYNIESNMEGIKNQKFVSDLQGKFYKNDLQGNFRTYRNGSLNMNCLGDYFSEGFREYFDNNKNLLNKDIELYNYIKGVLDGL